MAKTSFFEQLHQRKLPTWIWPLRLLSLIYRLGIDFRSGLYQCKMIKKIKVSIPVISVGNLTSGGTGKTPVIIALARHLIDQGHQVVILSRGYGAKQPKAYAIAQHPDDGDEAYLIQQAVAEATVIVGKDRAKNALQAIKDFQPDVILLDDGYQHWRLVRDLDIVLVDGENGFGNGALLPLGPLREPLSALKRAHRIVLTKDLKPQKHAPLFNTIQQYAPMSAYATPLVYWPFESSFHSVCSPAGQLILASTFEETGRVIALCGIARPESFFNSVKKLLPNTLLQQQLVFPDHHNYTQEDTQSIWQEHKDTWLLTTEKDWTKLQSLIPEAFWPRVVCLRVQPKIEPHQWRWLLEPLGDQFPDFIKPKNALGLVR